MALCASGLTRKRKNSAVPRELYDNAFSAGTSTALAYSMAATDTVLQTLGPASVVLQQPGQFHIIVIHADTQAIECMLVTANAWTSNWTVTRAQEGTTALAFPAGSVVRHILTAQAFKNIVAQGG
jgi:hypothetical protein